MWHGCVFQCFGEGAAIQVESPAAEITLCASVCSLIHVSNPIVYFCTAVQPFDVSFT